MGAGIVLRDPYLVAFVCQFQFGLPQELVELTHAANCVVISLSLNGSTQVVSNLSNLPCSSNNTLYVEHLKSYDKLPSSELFLESLSKEPTLPLHLSIAENNVRHVEMWIKNKPEWLTPAPLKLAAISGHFEIVKVLMKASKKTWTPVAMDLAARNGYLDIVKWIHNLEGSPGCTTNAMDGAATNGHLEMVQYLNEHRTEGCTSTAVAGAVKNGYSKVVEYLLNHRHEQYDGGAYFYAEYYRTHYHRAVEEKDYIGVLQCLHTRDILLMDEITITKAIASDPISAIKYFRQDGMTGITKGILDILIEIGDMSAIRCAIEGVLKENNMSISLLDHDNTAQPWTPLDSQQIAEAYSNGLFKFRSWKSSEAMDIAAGLGNLDAVILLHRSGIKCTTVNAMDYASAMGHLNVVEWLHTHRTEGCSNNAMTYAAAQGHLSVVKWLHEVKGLNCTKDGLRTAACNGDYAMVSYLTSIPVASGSIARSLFGHFHRDISIAGNSIAICRDDPISAAALKGHIDIIKLLHNFRSSKRAMSRAVKNGHLNVIEYLHETRNQRCRASTCRKAVKSNRLDILKYLVLNNCCDELIDFEALCLEASKVNNLDMLIFCMNHLQADLNQESKQVMMHAVAERGHLDIFKWLHESKGWALPTKEVAQWHYQKEIISYMDSIAEPKSNDVDDINNFLQALLSFAILPSRQMSEEIADQVELKTGFSLDAFTQAVCVDFDLATAATELDKCANNQAEIVKVYNGNGDVALSPLFVVINARPPRASKVEPKRLLAHPVLRKVVQMKWENFAKRMYLGQLILHCMFVLTMSLSASMNLGQSDVFHTQFMIWLYVGSPLLIIFVASRWYKPSNAEDWTGWTFLAILGTYILLQFYADTMTPLVNWTWFARANNIILALITIYFLAIEMNEFFAVSDTEILKSTWSCFPDYPIIHNIIYYCISVPLLIVLNFILLPLVALSDHPYFNSAFNYFQVPTYITMLVYILNEFIAIFSGDVRLYLGVFLSFMIWVLSLQYLEVHATASYLLPMMRAMAGDMARVMAFYAPFQFAFTFAYFLLFQGRDEATYSTINHCFVATFLVMLGQIELDPIENLPTTGSYVLGYIILLTHGTLVLVMLLNVIVAMMSKTVDGGLDKAKLEALFSFAERVLRCEKTAGLKEIKHDYEVPKETTHLLEKKEEEDDDVFGFTEPQEDIEFELKDISTDDRIEALQAKLDASMKKTEEMEATLKQVLELLLESKKNQ